MVKYIRQAMMVTITREGRKATSGMISSFLMTLTKTMETVTMADKTLTRTTLEATLEVTLEVTQATTRTSMVLTTATLATVAAEKSRLPLSQR
jgi:hypothetical protein